MRSMYNALLLAFALTLAAAPAHAGFLITYSDNFALSSGSSGTLDVYIQSDDPAATFNLAAFGAEFRITAAPGSSGPPLPFFGSQPDASSAPNYVFSGDSGGYSSSVSTSVTPNDTALVGDLTADFANVAVGAKKLLAQLAIVAPNHPPLTNASFSIDLVPSSGTSEDFYNGLSSTGFLDDQIDAQFNLQFNPIAFTSTSASVTILGDVPSGSVVPEPSTLTLLSLSLVGLAVGRRRKA